MIVPEPLQAKISGGSATLESTPEITAFEVPAGAPAWGFEVLNLNLEQELPNIKSFIDRTSALALVAGKRALSDAGLLAADKRPAGVEIGCAYGTMLGCLEAMGIFWNKVKTSNPKFAQPLPFTQSYTNSPSSLLCIEFGLRGPAATFSGEKLSGFEALQFAFDQIAAGAGSIILTGASESLSPYAFNHLLANKQLSIKGDWSDGIVPGEGGAMLVLESLESAQKRGAKIYAEITGVEAIAADLPWSEILVANDSDFASGALIAELNAGKVDFARGLAGDSLSVPLFINLGLADRKKTFSAAGIADGRGRAGAVLLRKH